MHQELKNKLNNFNSHSKHISKAEKIYNLSKILKQDMDINLLLYENLIIQTDFYINTIMELIDSIFISFKYNHYTTIETTSRVSIEMSINLLLILDCDDDKASNGLLKHYFKYKKNKTELWKKYSESTNDKNAVKIADRELNTTSIYEKNMNINNYNEWPDSIYKKFKKLELEEIYKTVFASSSDSIHTLSEDIFNITLLKQVSLENYKEVFLSEKKSFAIYLMLVSLELFNFSLYKFASKIENTELNKKIENNHKEIIHMIEEHNNHV